MESNTHDLKEFLEDAILDKYADELYNMSINELQREADRLNVDITKLFLQKT